jgi:tetratricopeptide (TPR) repeat protein
MRAELAGELLALALARPMAALARADELLRHDPEPADASVAHQARAIVLRDTGRVDEAIRELRTALRFAERSGDGDRTTDVHATLGLTLGLAGRTAAGLRALDRAAAASRGAVHGRVLMRRGHLLAVVGRYPEALADFRTSIARLHRAGDGVWEARARVARFSVYARLGQAARGDRDLVVAERLFAAAGQDLESTMTVHNRADVAFQVGDLPAALDLLDQAGARYAELGAHKPELAIDRCAVLLAAGLSAEAVATTEAAIREHVGRGGEATKTAELLFVAARAAQAAGRADLAAEWAGQARALFRRQHRRGWQARAGFVVVQGRYAAGEHLNLGKRSGQLRLEASRLADRLTELRALEAPAAHLLVGRLATGAVADRHLARAARYRYGGPTFGRAAGWLAQALRARERGATAAMLAACRRGLDAAGEHQRSLAAPELRAHAAGYGTELAALAQRHAVGRGDARMLLRWSERWRAGALAVPLVRPPDDRELAADLAALRQVMRRLAAPDAPVVELDRERHRLEAAIRSRTRRVRERPPAADQPPVPFDRLAGHHLVELTVVDGVLYAVTVTGRRVRLHEVGAEADAVREVTLARSLLRRLAHGRTPPQALSTLARAGAALERALLGPAAADLDGAPVLVVPPARLHAVPWSLLPTLRAAPVTVAPSAATWVRAGRAAPRRGHAAFVVGPGLAGSAAEVKRIADGYPDPIVLSDGRATAEAALAALDGAAIAHVAAHGVFRADNALFSALSLDDGPLTVYDLGRLRRAPARLVLSSCESGVAAEVAADELLGMVSALVPLGTASILASIVPVNDAATAPVMVGFHERLLAGHTFGAALHGARMAAEADGDPVAVATALSFVALGR